MMIKNILCKIILPIFLLFSTVTVKLSYANSNTPTKAELLNAGKQLEYRAQVLCCESEKVYDNPLKHWKHRFEMAEMCHWSTHNDMIRQGTCDIPLTFDQCKQAAKMNAQHDGNTGFGGEFSDIEKPYGCIQKTDQKYYFNQNKDSKAECGPVHGEQFSEKCICYSRSCENKTYQEASNFCKKNDRQLCSKEQIRDLESRTHNEGNYKELKSMVDRWKQEFNKKFSLDILSLKVIEMGPYEDNPDNSSSPHWINDFGKGTWANDGSRIAENDFLLNKENYQWRKKDYNIQRRNYGDFTFLLHGDKTPITMSREQILAYFNIDDYDALKQELEPERVPVEQIAEENPPRAIFSEGARDVDWIAVCEEKFSEINRELQKCDDGDLKCYNTAIAPTTEIIEEPFVSKENQNRTQCHGVLNTEILPRILRWCEKPDKTNCTTKKISKLFNIEDYVTDYDYTQSRVKAGYIKRTDIRGFWCPCEKYKGTPHKGIICENCNFHLRPDGYSSFMVDLIQKLQKIDREEIEEFIKNHSNQSEGE